MNQIPIIGITGATGSGKSLVCKTLAKNNAFIICADTIAHNIIRKGCPAYVEILAAFPIHTYLEENAEIDRKKLGEIVFADESKLKILTDITHRYIIEEILAKIAETRTSPGSYTSIIINAPLLIESGLHIHCDKIIGIIADDALRISRIIKRDSISTVTAERRASKQTPLGTLKKYADIIIENNGTIEELMEKISCLLT